MSIGTSRLWIVAILVAVSLSFAESAETAPIITIDQATYLAAAGPQAVIDFDDFPNFTEITSQYAALGVTFTDGNDVIATACDGEPDGGCLLGDGLPANDLLGINFILNGPRTSVGLVFGEVYASLGVSVSFFSGSTNIGGLSGFATFAGIVNTDTPIDRVTIGAILSGTDRAALLDLLIGPEATPTAVPEPASLLLVGTGVAGLAFRRRRSR